MMSISTEATQGSLLLRCGWLIIFDQKEKMMEAGILSYILDGALVIIAALSLWISYCTSRRQNKMDEKLNRRSLAMGINVREGWSSVASGKVKTYDYLEISITNDSENPITLLEIELLILDKMGRICKTISGDSHRIRNKSISPGEILIVKEGISQELQRYNESNIRLKVKDTLKNEFISLPQYFSYTKNHR